MRACSTRTATRSCWPRPTRRASPTTRRSRYEIAHIVKDGLRRMYGEPRTAEDDVFYYLTVYNEPIQHPAEPAKWTSRASSRASTASRRASSGAHPGADPGLRRGDAVGPGGPADPRRGVERHGRRLVRDLLERAAPRRPGGRGAQPAAPGGGAARPVRDAEARRRRGPVRGGLATGCGRCRTRSPAGCPARTSRSARTASASPTPAARPAASSTSTPSRSCSAVLTELAKEGKVDRSAAEAGDRPLPAAGRRGGRPGRGGRRRLTAARRDALAVERRGGVCGAGRGTVSRRRRSPAHTGARPRPLSAAGARARTGSEGVVLLHERPLRTG